MQFFEFQAPLDLQKTLFCGQCFHWKQINEIVVLLQEYLLNQNLDYFIFIIHDMEAFESWMYQIDKNGFTRKKYDQYTARGSTIIPELQEKLPPKQYKKTS